MTQINIGRSNDNDPSYRYKMPQMIIKLEGAGNGRRTAILNIREVCKALKCDVAYPTKFFGAELGAQSKFDKFQSKTVITGFHEAKELMRLLDKFIDLFVLCPKCTLPEISLSVNKGLVLVDCAACGYNAPLSNKHKFTSFISKNPPTVRMRAKEEPIPTVEPIVDDDKEEWATDISAEAIESRRKEALKILDPSASLQSTLETCTIVEIAREVQTMPRGMYFLLSILAEQKVDKFLEQIEKWYQPLFKELDNQDELLDALTLLFEKEDFGKRAIRILSTFYDMDLLDEQHILAWSKRTARQRPEVLKFVQWLETVEENE